MNLTVVGGGTTSTKYIATTSIYVALRLLRVGSALQHPQDLNSFVLSCHRTFNSQIEFQLGLPNEYVSKIKSRTLIEYKSFG